MYLALYRSHRSNCNNSKNRNFELIVHSDSSNKVVYEPTKHIWIYIDYSPKNGAVEALFVKSLWFVQFHDPNYTKTAVAILVFSFYPDIKRSGQFPSYIDINMQSWKKKYFTSILEQRLENQFFEIPGKRYF